MNQDGKYTFQQRGNNIIAFLDGKRVCTKTGYDTEQKAKEWLRRIRHKVQQNKQRTPYPRRAYLCPICGMWHLTSRK